MECENETQQKQGAPKWHYAVYAACTDGTLNKLVDQKNLVRVEVEQSFSVLRLFNGLTKPRAFFGGVSQRNYPGSIRLLNQEYQNLQELQVHS